MVVSITNEPRPTDARCCRCCCRCYFLCENNLCCCFGRLGASIWDSVGCYLHVVLGFRKLGLDFALLALCLAVLQHVFQLSHLLHFVLSLSLPQTAVDVARPPPIKPRPFFHSCLPASSRLLLRCCTTSDQCSTFWLLC